MRHAPFVLAAVVGLVAMGRTARGQGLVARTEWSDTRRLDISPDTAGLLVVDIRIDDAGRMLQSSSAALLRTGGRWRPAFFTGGGGVDSILLFHLQPGTYVLSTVTVSPPWMARAVTFNIESSELAPIEVRAGEIQYVGHLTISKRMLTFHLTYAWNRSDSVKVKALESILRRYPDSPWVPILRRTIASSTPADSGRH